MKRYLVYPDLVIYLRVSPEVSIQRIQERGRQAENGITLDYMEKLHSGYENFAEEMNRYTRVLTLEWNQYQDTDEVVQMIREKSCDKRSFLRDLKRN